MATVKQTFLTNDLTVIGEYPTDTQTTDLASELSFYIRLQLAQGFYPTSVKFVRGNFYVISWEKSVRDVAFCFVTNGSVVNEVIYQSDNISTRRYLEQLHGQPIHVLRTQLAQKSWHLRAEIEGHNQSVSLVSP